MSSTSADNTSLEVSEFFFEELVPLANKLRSDGKVFFSVKADSNLQTYYVKRVKTTMVPEDFELAGFDSIGSLEEVLVDMWLAQENPELASIAGTVSRLSRSLRFVKEQNQEVSPFIYVMF